MKLYYNFITSGKYNVFVVGGIMAKILVVEDEIAINNLIKKNLQLVGHECVQVFDGEKAVDTALLSIKMEF
jgi:PleD family two-component response regulator